MLGAFDYARPRSVEEASRLLGEAGDARVLAGGTDLLVEIRNGLRAPELLVDVKSIDELGRLEIGDSDFVIGACVPLNVIAEHRGIRDALPALADAALSIGTYQLRNRATLVGNLCNASPAADSAPVLLTLDAAVSVSGPQGRRVVPIAELFAGVKRTCLARGEIATDVRIPRPSPDTRTAFLKQQRIRGHDLAVVNVAASLSPGRNALRVAVGSCAPTPVLLDPVDASADSLDALVERVVALAESATSPISDVRASAAYRRAVLPVLIRRSIESLFKTGGAS